MTHVRDERGGVVGQVICSILAILGAVATIAVVRIAIDRIREGGDPGVLAVVIVPGLFTLAFLGLAVFFGVELRQDKVLAERQALNPDQPWLWSDEWREGRIAPVSSGKTALLVAVFAGFWNTFVVAAVLAVWKSGTSMETGYWLFLAVFGLVGVGLVAGALYLSLQARKSPPTVFEMSTFPGVLGGDLSGTIALPPHLPAGADALLRVSCVRTLRSARRNSDTTMWQDEMTLQTPSAGVLPVAFRIPFELPPSQAPARSDEPSTALIRWYLSVDVSVPGVDYSQLFVVPVFATRASDHSVVAGQVDKAAAIRRPSLAKATLVESSSERTVIDLPTPQGRGCGVAALVLLPVLAWPISRYSGADTATALTAVGVALVAGAGLMLLAGLMLAWTAARVEIDDGGDPRVARTLAIPAHAHDSGGQRHKRLVRHGRRQVRRSGGRGRDHILDHSRQFLGNRGDQVARRGGERGGPALQGRSDVSGASLIPARGQPRYFPGGRCSSVSPVAVRGLNPFQYV